MNILFLYIYLKYIALQVVCSGWLKSVWYVPTLELVWYVPTIILELVYLFVFFLFLHTKKNDMYTLFLREISCGPRLRQIAL